MQVVQILLFLAIAAIAGCALTAKVTDQVVRVANLYCTEPYAARQLYRETINAELAANGHRLTMTCRGDPAPAPE